MTSSSSSRSWAANPLQPVVLNFLKRSYDISTSLFSPNGAEPQMKFSISIRPSPQLSQITFSVDGKEVVYKNEPERWTQFTWPGDGKTSGAFIKVPQPEDQRPEELIREGEWGLFRLMEEGVAQIDKGSRVFTMTWKMPQHEVGGGHRLQARAHRHAVLRHLAGAGHAGASAVPRRRTWRLRGPSEGAQDVRSETANSVALLGKAPCQGDFIRWNAGDPVSAQFHRGWRRGTRPYAAPTCCCRPSPSHFVFSAAGGRQALVGMMAPSSDKVGRVSSRSPCTCRWTPRRLAGNATTLLHGSHEAFFAGRGKLLADAASSSADELHKRVEALYAQTAGTRPPRRPTGARRQLAPASSLVGSSPGMGRRRACRTTPSAPS